MVPIGDDLEFQGLLRYICIVIVSSLRLRFVVVKLSLRSCGGMFFGRLGASRALSRPFPVLGENDFLDERHAVKSSLAR